MIKPFIYKEQNKKHKFSLEMTTFFREKKNNGEKL